MKLTLHRLAKFDMLYRIGDKRYKGIVHSYDGVNKLYDVIYIPELELKVYKVNMRVAEKNEWHEAIEKHYHIKGDKVYAKTE
jgi:hypothetical protein